MELHPSLLASLKVPEVEAVLKRAPMASPGKPAARAAMLRFPQAFPSDPTKVRPLCIGIDQELVAALGEQAGEVGERGIRLFLAWWCRRPCYVKALANGAARYNLQGEMVARISKEDRVLFLKKARDAGFLSATSPRPPRTRPPKR